LPASLETDGHQTQNHPTLDFCPPLGDFTWLFPSPGPVHARFRECFAILCGVLIPTTKSFLRPATMSSFDVQNLFGVNGKVVLVTGGSRGIGKMVRVPILACFHVGAN